MTKKIIIVATLFVSILAFAISCSKSSSTDLNQIPPPNQPYTIHSSAQTDIRASDVESTPLIIKRQIEIINRLDNSVTNTFILTITNDDPKTNIFETIKLKKATATFTIESNDQTLFKAQAINGVSQVGLVYRNANTTFDISSPKPTIMCTLYQVTSCVNSRIVAMNWIDYLACCATAPACYAQLWASCTWDLCAVQK